MRKTWKRSVGLVDRQKKPKSNIAGSGGDFYAFPARPQYLALGAIFPKSRYGQITAHFQRVDSANDRAVGGDTSIAVGISIARNELPAGGPIRQVAQHPA